MSTFCALNDLLKHDTQCKVQFDQLPKEQRIALEEQCQHIRTREEFTAAVRGLKKLSDQ